MRRKSHLPRRALPFLSERPTDRPEYFKPQLEPLEERHLLTTLYVNDSWIDGNGGLLNPGDPVSAGGVLDPISVGISGTYGVNCFGKSNFGNFTLSARYIANAVSAAANGDVISICEGTYTESDIVINKQLVISGTGTSGTADTLLVPETTSAQSGSALANFGVGTHSGLILYSDSAWVHGIHLNGSAGTAATGSLNYHHGITTLYDTQAGGSYASTRNGSLTPIQLGAVPDPINRPNRSTPTLRVENVLVENTFWHGITISALAGKQFGPVGTGRWISISNCVVQNVGAAASQGYDKVGILLQNIDDGEVYGFPDYFVLPEGSIFQCTINKAGVGAATRLFGNHDVNNGAYSRSTVAFTTVNNAVMIGIEYTQNEDEANCKMNVINFAPGNNAIGLLIENSAAARYSKNTITNAHVGVKIVNSSLSDKTMPTLTLMSVTGPGTAEAGSIGVLISNSASAPEASANLTFGLDVSGYQTGVKAEQTYSTVKSGYLASIASNGAGATRVTTSSAHAMSSGDRVEIFGVVGNPLTGGISGAASNGSGRIRVTTSAAHNMSTGTTVNITGVGGTTEANGPWTITFVDATHFDLQESTFINAYTSGGAYESIPSVNGGWTATVISATQFDIATPYSYSVSSTTYSPATWRSPPQSHLLVDRANVHGNAVGYSISGNYLVEGALSTPDPVIDPGATFTPGITTQPFLFYNSISNQVTPTVGSAPPSPTGVIPAPETVEAVSTGNFTLDSSSTLRININGTQTFKSIQTFDTPRSFFPLGAEFNPWRTGFASPAVGGDWFSGVEVTGGALVINRTNFGDDVGIVYELGNTGSPIDMRGMQQLQISAAVLNGNQADEFYLYLIDADGTAYGYLVPMYTLNSVTYTTLSVNVASPTIAFQTGESGLNMSAITGWAISGDFGDSDMEYYDIFRLAVDTIGMVAPQANSQVNVSGAVNLNGATLSATVNNFTPTMSQTFTIINNDGMDAVNGTFAGLPQGATTIFGGFAFRISYFGGVGLNDVTLTRVPQVNSSVAKTNLFYKDSTKWNVTNGTTFSDDNAIAPDKTAYLPGSGTSSFSAVSSYVNGINGIMVDLSGVHGAITVNDFKFKAGNNNSPSTWAMASAPTTVTTRAGAGTSGSDRIELIWDNNQSVKKAWLQVIVEGNDSAGSFNTNTGLASSYVFYFGNALGDSGTGNSGAFQVTSADEVNARNNPKTFTATRSDVNDYNRDGSVNSSDQIIARNNTTNLGNQLKFLVVGAGGPFAPESWSAANGDSGVGSGLAGSSTAGPTLVASPPPWLRDSTDVEQSRAAVARVFARFALMDTVINQVRFLSSDPPLDESSLGDETLDVFRMED
jgi:hypothetical protein